MARKSLLLFQFLIGRLRIQGELFDWWPYLEFQFLIGRLRIKKTRKAELRGIPVSIPHR